MLFDQNFITLLMILTILGLSGLVVVRSQINTICLGYSWSKR